tara:strand:- start:320 stop:1921 length:1602 start_codon:yes stop_codon:yes gene_type:complete
MSKAQMDTIVKYQSRQGGNFTTTLNKVDFSIPEGIYDFSQSHIELLIRYPRATFPAVAGGDGVHNSRNCVVPFVINPRGNAEKDWTPATYVRRCRLMSQNHGVLEDIDRVDVLRNTLASYKEDVAGKESVYYKSPSQTSQTNTIYTPFRDLRYEGSVVSTARDERVIIKLSDLFELGSESLVPMDRRHLGRGNIHLDLELDNISAVRTPTDITGVVGGKFPMALRSSQVLTESAGGTIAVSTLTTIAFTARQNWKDTFDHIYVGAAVTLTNNAASTANGAIPSGGEFVITKIEKGQNPTHYPNPGAAPNNNLLITFDKGVNPAMTAGQTFILDMVLTAPSVAPVPTYVEAQIVLQQKNMMPPRVDSLNYMTFTTELVATNGNSWQNQYVVEPSAINVFITNCPDQATLPFSTMANVNDYRLALNSKPIIPRDISIGASFFSTLHYELISQAFINGTMKLDSLLECCLLSSVSRPSSKILPAYSGVANKNLLIATPVPITNGVKLFQLQLNSLAQPGAIGNLQLYKQVVRSIKF